MEDNETDNNKNISGLSFKSLFTSEDSKDDSLNGDEGYLFINDDIERKNFYTKVKESFNGFVKKQSGKKNLLAFFLAFFTYLYSRARVIWILMSVFIDLLISSLDFIKEKSVQGMFWGRGNFLKSTLQIIFLIVVVILTVSFMYRKPVVIEASSDTLDSVGVAETDVLVMNATVNTLIPKERGRRYVETYTVKGGDTLSRIAKNYDIKVETILWANNLTSKSTIKPGMVLQIPPMDGVLVAVKKGDTVESLAKKYSARAADIVDHNWLEKPYKLKPGDTIFIPEGEPPVKKPVYASSPSSFYRSSSIAYKSTPVDSSVGRFLSWPVAGPSKISRGFLPHIGHYAIDIYPTKGKPSVVAAAGGRVISAGWGSGKYYGFGYYAHVDHGNGYTTLYAHMDKLYARAGQSVSRGQALGIIGDTGVAYGIHLHFELRRGAELSGRINPAPYMR